MKTFPKHWMVGKNKIGSTIDLNKQGGGKSMFLEGFIVSWVDVTLNI